MAENDLRLETFAGSYRNFRWACRIQLVNVAERLQQTAAGSEREWKHSVEGSASCQCEVWREWSADWVELGLSVDLRYSMQSLC